MKKLLLIFTLCITLLSAGGFRAKALEAARAQITQYGGFGPFGGVQTDDPAIMKRLEEIVSAAMKREPLTNVPENVCHGIQVTLDLDSVLSHAVFMESLYMELDQVRYPCTESEFNEIVKMTESAQPQKDLVYWVFQDEKGEAAAENFSMTKGAAETLAKMVEDAPPIWDVDEFPREDGEQLWVSFYNGDQLEYFIFSSQWLRRDSDGILYQRITPEQYETVKRLLDVENEPLPLPLSATKSSI